MSEILEIAYAAASNRLCLFTGTGFSKAVSNNNAPSWQSLLESVSELAKKPEDLKKALFPTNGKNLLSLEEAAQVISLELNSVKKSIHQEIARVIKDITLSAENNVVADFFSTRTFKVITTNYDKLAEKLAGKDCQCVSPGLPIPRSQSRVKIYHVHGSVDSPENMIVTADDYFKFINNETYFSKKVSTILHENTVVILGYSLGDTNLKAIINDYRNFSKNLAVSSSIFFVAREKIDSRLKDYYGHCYGIRVIDELEVRDFFLKLSKVQPTVEKEWMGVLTGIEKVVSGKFAFSDEYLKTENAFVTIISSLAAIGLSIGDTRVVKSLGLIVEEKVKHASKDGAWEQYDHLAKWLIYLATLLDLGGTSIEKVFLDAALKSMNSMGSNYQRGLSWRAYNSWNCGWERIKSANRTVIRNHIKKLSSGASSDALKIVSGD